MLTRNRNWFVYASTDRLRRLLDRPDARRLAAIAVLFHQRLTRPILGLLLVFLGLSVILHDQRAVVLPQPGQLVERILRVPGEILKGAIGLLVENPIMLLKLASVWTLLATPLYLALRRRSRARALAA